MSTLSLTITPTTTTSGPALDELLDHIEDIVAYHIRESGYQPADATFTTMVAMPYSKRSSHGPRIVVTVRGDWDFAPLGKLADVIAEHLLASFRDEAAEPVIRVSATRMDPSDGTMQSTLYRRKSLSPGVFEERGPIIETGIIGGEGI